jgi:NAD(P)-dependent dehydrogenase (short-subunit alcohol dehydrogenase family)
MATASAIRFDGRVVTGAGNGMGSNYALNLAARGAKVVVNDLGVDTWGKPLGGDAESAAQAVVQQIKAAGGEAVACHASCATREGGQAIIDTAMAAFGRVDIVIHCRAAVKWALPRSVWNPFGLTKKGRQRSSDQ